MMAICMWPWYLKSELLLMLPNASIIHTNTVSIATLYRQILHKSSKNLLPSHFSSCYPHENIEKSLFASLSSSKMQLTSILIGLLSTLPSTLSAPASSIARNDDPQMCGYVLTAQNSSVYAGISAYTSCTPIYYNQSIPGYQAAFAYSIFDGCRCTFHG